MKKFTIAIIEDNYSLNLLMLDLISRHGFDVIGFTDPTEFIEQFDQINPSAVLTDYMMPKLNGIELIKKIRNLSPSLPCILITGSLNFEISLQAALLNCVGIYPKPFDFSSLIENLKSLFLNSAASTLSEISKQENFNNFINKFPEFLVVQNKIDENFYNLSKLINAKFKQARLKI